MLTALSCHAPNLEVFPAEATGILEQRSAFFTKPGALSELQHMG